MVLYKIKALSNQERRISMKDSSCKTCRHFRISDPLKHKICDFWRKNIKEEDEIIGCNAFEEKSKEELE